KSFSPGFLQKKLEDHCPERAGSFVVWMKLKHTERLPKDSGWNRKLRSHLTVKRRQRRDPERGLQPASASETEMTAGNHSNQKRKKHYEIKVHACLCNVGAG